MEIKASGLGIALGGIERGFRDLGEAASEIARGVKEETQIEGLANTLVDVIEAQRQIEASANVVRRIDETLGTLVDTFV